MARLALQFALSLALTAAGAIGTFAQTAPAPPPAAQTAPSPPPAAQTAPAPAVAAQAAPAVATTQFDYYVMTLSWAPGFCDLGGKETSSPECAEGSGDGFVVHGLWPNNEYRPSPESCLGRDPTSDDLEDEHGVYPNDRLAAYEYRKHGTCTGLSPHDYFAVVRSVRARLKIPEMFQAPSEQLHMAPEEVAQAFMAANPNLHPDNMAISCSNAELVDVRFCLAKDLSSYAICRKVARHTCQRTSIVVAPVR
jgi:ribonuclease T2